MWPRPSPCACWIARSRGGEDLCEGKAPLLWTKGAASPSTPKNFIRACLCREGKRKHRPAGQAEVFPRTPNPSSQVLFLSLKIVVPEHRAGPVAAAGLRDAQHDMARCPRRQAAGGAGMADTLRAAFLLSLPRLAFFCPERRKARGARLPMSCFWGEGEFEGEGPLFTAGKRGPPPQASQPGRSSIKQKRAVS